MTTRTSAKSSPLFLPQCLDLLPVWSFDVFLLFHFENAKHLLPQFLWFRKWRWSTARTARCPRRSPTTGMVRTAWTTRPSCKARWLPTFWWLENRCPKVPSRFAQLPFWLWNKASSFMPIIAALFPAGAGGRWRWTGREGEGVRTGHRECQSQCADFFHGRLQGGARCGWVLIQTCRSWWWKMKGLPMLLVKCRPTCTFSSLNRCYV